MKTELIDISQTRKEIKINIEAADVRAEYDRVSSRYMKLANVPGFRKGRAPLSIVRRHYKDEIRSEVLRELLPGALTTALETHKLNPLGEPDIHLDNNESLENLGEQPISLHAHVDVLPKIELGEYKGLEIARRTRPITDADVDIVIEQMREESAALDPVEDRGAQNGDTVTVDFHGKFTNAPEEEDIDAPEVDVVLGGENVLEEINQNLLDARADDERQFTVHYPEDFNAEGLAGRTVDYQAKVTAVRVKVLPEADDEWARSVGDGVETIAELRTRIRESLEASMKAEAERRLRDELMDKLIVAHNIELPDVLVESQAQRLLESAVYDMMQRGFDPRNANVNWESLRHSLRGRAEQELRGSLLLESIADKEKVAISDTEVDEEITKIAEAMKQTPEQVRAALTKQGGESSIADRLRVRRTLDTLVEHARITDEEWREEEETPAEAVAAVVAAPGDSPDTSTEAHSNNSTTTDSDSSAESSTPPTSEQP